MKASKIEEYIQRSLRRRAITLFSSKNTHSQLNGRKYPCMT